MYELGKHAELVDAFATYLATLVQHQASFEEYRTDLVTHIHLQRQSNELRDGRKPEEKEALEESKVAGP